MSDQTRIVIDRIQCQSHGLCAASAPDVFDLDDLGQSLPHQELVSGERVHEAQLAADSCPELAISLLPPEQA